MKDASGVAEEGHCRWRQRTSLRVQLLNQFGDALAVGVVAAVAMDFARERDPRSVRRELRQARTGADRRYPLRLAARNVDHVDLIRRVALALGRECDPPAVGTPARARLG